MITPSILEQRNAPRMPYIPYWFESFANWFPWIVPFLAIAALWIARLMDDAHWRNIAERCFFMVLVIAACGTLRTVLENDPCWLMHTGSFGLMVLGAIFPQFQLDGEVLANE